MPKGSGPRRSLEQFNSDQRRKHCPVCALDEDVRQQIAAAGARKIPLTVQLEWLEQEVGVQTTSEALISHKNGRHDAKAA